MDFSAGRIRRRHLVGGARGGGRAAQGSEGGKVKSHINVHVVVIETLIFPFSPA